MAEEHGPLGREHVLLVEGPEEMRFWQAFLGRLRRGDVSVLQTGGKAALRDSLRILARTKGFGRVRWLGVAQDADARPAGTFTSIRDALQVNNLPAPATAWTTATRAGLSVTIFVWPGPNRAGDLETMIWEQLAPQPAAPCVEDYLHCLERAGAAPRAAWRAKARVRAYLASLERQDVGLVEAVRAGLLPLAGGQFARVVELLPAPMVT